MNKIGNNVIPIIDWVTNPIEPIFDDKLVGKNDVIYIGLPQCGQTDVPRGTILPQTGQFLLAITAIAASPSIPRRIPASVSSSLPIFVNCLVYLIKMTEISCKILSARKSCFPQSTVNN